MAVPWEREHDYMTLFDSFSTSVRRRHLHFRTGSSSEMRIVAVVVPPELEKEMIHTEICSVVDFARK